MTAPVDLLRDVHIVDTPGTNAIIREHERLTTDFVPRADLVLFVTSADRPFTETERAFLETIRGWGKKIVIVVNKIDIFERRAELDEVLDVRPRVGAASARDRRRKSFRSAPAWRSAPSRATPASWAASRFEALETFIAETLDESQPLPPQAGQPARRRPGAGAPLRDDRRRTSHAADGRCRRARRHRPAARRLSR